MFPDSCDTYVPDHSIGAAVLAAGGSGLRSAEDAWKALASSRRSHRSWPASPQTVSLAMPIASASLSATATASSCLSLGTNVRVGALQDCPVFIITYEGGRTTPDDTHRPPRAAVNYFIDVTCATN